MTVVSALLGFAVVAGLLTLVPGLDTALVLRSTLTRSRRYAWATAFGIATGAMVWGIAAAVGISALLAASQTAYRVLTIAGALYMVWLGLSMIRASFARAKNGPAPETEAPAIVPDSALRGWAIGATTNLLNPKVGVFYVAAIPQFLPAGVSPLLMGILLAGVHALLALAWFGVVIVGGRAVGRLFEGPRALALIDRITGALLLVFGARLLLDAR